MQADENDEATLLMATFYALHDVEAKEKGEVMAVEGHDKALKAVHLANRASKSTSDVWATGRSSGGTWTLASATT